MENKLDKNYTKYRKRKILRYIIIVLMLLTIILSVLSLLGYMTFLIPLGVFIIATCLVKYRDSLAFLEPKKKKD